MNCIGVVVTYNRKELLLENLRMLSKQSLQLDKVLIIDNHSKDGTQEAVFKEFGLNNEWIDYRYMDENLGGAGGFYYGVKWARKLDYDFLWLMDDDGRPFNEATLENIFAVVPELYQKNHLLFLNSLVTYDGRHLSFGFWATKDRRKQLQRIKVEEINGILYNKVNPFNGTLISKELIDVVGYPRKEFFMYRDEVDYMRRSEKCGALIGTVINSIYFHPISKCKFKKIGNCPTQIYDNSDLVKEYYFIRNLTYTYKKDNWFKIMAFILIRMATIILYEDKKIIRIKQVFEALNDAKNDNMGIRK